METCHKLTASPMTELMLHQFYALHDYTVGQPWHQ